MFSSRSGRIIRSYTFLQEAKEKTPPGDASRRQAGSSGLPSVEVQLEADAILAQARLQAEAEAQEIREAALKEGFEAGRLEGREAGISEGRHAAEEQMRKEVGQLHQIIDGIVAGQRRFLQATENDLVELALAIARKVVGDAANRHIDVVVKMAESAVEALGQPGSVQVHLNPRDAERLKEYWQFDEGHPEWEVVEDERISAGGCLVTSGPSLVDVRPEKQLELIRRAFRKTIGEG